MKALYFALLAALLLTLTAQADPRLWDPAGVAVRTGTYLQPNPVAVADDAGNALYVWADVQNGSLDICAQLVSAQGAELWTAGGVTVCGEVSPQSHPAACRVSDGWIVTWLDSRDPGYEGVYAQKLGTSGVRQWSANDFTGVCVRAHAMPSWGSEWQGSYSPPYVVTDGADGAFVVWYDHMADIGDILAQRLLGSGSLAWADPVAACNASGEQAAPVVAPDGAGNLLVAWIDKRNAADYDIYAAKVTPDGQTPWGANGRAVCIAADDQLNIQICADGAGGGYVAWDSRPGGSSLASVYLQRLNAAGEMQFTAGTLQLCDHVWSWSTLCVTSSWNGAIVDGCLVAWEDLRANGLVKEVYAQKVSPTGTPLWGANGLKLCGDANPDPDNPSGSSRQSPQVVSDAAGGLVGVWEDARNTDGASFDLYAVRVLSAGTLSWNGTCGNLTADGPGTQGAPLVRLIPGVGVGVGFDDGRTGSGSLRLQTLSLTDGSRLLAPEGIILVASLDGMAGNSKVIALSAGRTATVWEDMRSAHIVLDYQIIGPDGNITRAVNGDRLAPDNEGLSRLEQQNATLAEDGNGGFFIAFEDMRTGRRRIRLQRIDAEDELACTAAARLVYSDELTTDQKEAFIAPDGQGGCYLAWSNLNDSYIPDVFVMRFDANCQPAAGWNEPVRLSETPDDEEAALGLAADGQGCCVVAWRYGIWGQYNLGGAKICGDGSVTWNRPLCDAAGTQECPVLSGDGSGGVYAVWEDRRTLAHNTDIFAQRLNAMGEEQWAHNGVAVISDTLLQDRPQIATDTQGNFCVVWEDFRSAATSISTRRNCRCRANGCGIPPVKSWPSPPATRRRPRWWLTARTAGSSPGPMGVTSPTITLSSACSASISPSTACLPRTIPSGYRAARPSRTLPRRGLHPSWPRATVTPSSFGPRTSRTIGGSAAEILPPSACTSSPSARRTNPRRCRQSSRCTRRIRIRSIPPRRLPSICRLRPM